MSGGGRKKATRVEGWEKADGEFYQERYPTSEGELEVFQKDPSHIATLLPSKQSRAGIIYFFSLFCIFIEYTNLHFLSL